MNSAHITGFILMDPVESPTATFKEPSPLKPSNPVNREDSASSQSRAIKSSSSSSQSLVIPRDMPSRLGDFFSIGEKRRARYSDWDIQEISRHLHENERQAWSQVPRLYTVLRTIGQLQVIDAVLDQGISDIWFPFNASSVPGALSSSMRKEFLEMQHLVLTKAVDLEKSELRPHAHFGKDEIFPFEVRERLGRGGFGTVDKIFSSFSRREFARKRFARGKTPESKRREVQNFKTELQVLKRIQHHHCVELVG